MELFKSNSFGYVCKLAQEYDQNVQLIDACSVCIRSVLSSLPVFMLITVTRSRS